jgi:putative spermidine/putrescine transport system permease protein
MRQMLLKAVMAAAFLFLLAPILMVVVSSFSGGGAYVFPPPHLTTRWYESIDAGYYSALRVTLIVATVTSVVACLLGVPAGIGLARARFWGRDMISAICLSPLMTPALVMAVALFQFALIVWDHTRLSLMGSITGLVLGHLTFAIPFTIRAILSSHTNYDHSIEEAAANLGANPLQIFWRITLPVLRPGIVSGFVMSFLMSVDEVPIALFLGGGDATTLPVRIFTAIEISFGGEILAVSALVVGASVIAMLILDRLIGLDRLFIQKA